MIRLLFPPNRSVKTNSDGSHVVISHSTSKEVLVHFSITYYHTTFRVGKISGVQPHISCLPFLLLFFQFFSFLIVSMLNGFRSIDLLHWKLLYGLDTQLSLNCLSFTVGFCVRYRLRSVLGVFKLNEFRFSFLVSGTLYDKGRFPFRAHSVSERCYCTKKFYNNARGVSLQKDVG